MAGTVHSVWRGAAGRVGQTGTPERIFPWWSFTKTVIAICALRAAERGLLDLDLPRDGMTLRQLLRHEAGLADYGALPGYKADVAAGRPPWSRARLLAELPPPPHPPGQGWRYSNPGYMLARERVEAATGRDLATLVAEDICAPLGLRGLRLARDLSDMAAIHWPAGRQYHPGWVYHGLLIGPAGAAAELLHGLAMGRLLSPDSLAQMRQRHPLGGAIPGRPWEDTGYGLGLMSGTLRGAGRVWGHSGAGPFSVNAVYHFADLAEPLTVASFTDGHDEGRAEWAAVRIATGGGVARGPG